MEVKDLESSDYNSIKKFCEESFDLNQYPKKYKKNFKKSNYCPHNYSGFNWISFKK